MVERIMKKHSRTPRPAGRAAAGGGAALLDDLVASVQDKAAKASLEALEASLIAGSSAGAQGYAATALELAALAVQMNRMTGDLAVALKILRDVAPPTTYALNALGRLLAAEVAAIAGE
jgi:hypothetical protein